MPNVIKRDGREVKFNTQKIVDAICNAARDVGEDLNAQAIKNIEGTVLNYIDKNINKDVTVEEIQNFVIKSLKENGYGHIASYYSGYREERTKVREIKSDLMKAIAKIGVETDRDNANVGNVRLAS
ncbi:MAG: ATP cone domain-containing protein [Sarcina sp.]